MVSVVGGAAEKCFDKTRLKTTSTVSAPLLLDVKKLFLLKNRYKTIPSEGRKTFEQIYFALTNISIIR